MKVLQILPELNAGGVERGTLEIANHLVKQGHTSLVVSNGGRLVAQLEAQGSRHIAMPVHRKSPLSLLQVRPLRKLLERERPDILHIRSRVPGWIAWLAWRGMDVARRPRLVSTVHGFNSVNAYSAIMTRGERVIAVSNCIRDFVLNNYPKTPAEKIRVIPRGVELGQYPRGFKPDADWLAAWQKSFPQSAGKRILTLPGRITRLKGHEDFLRLIKSLSREGLPVHGLIVGGAHEKKESYLDELKSLTRTMGIEGDVSFTGHRSDLREVLAISDIVYSLSTQPESFGRTTLEALALGRTVIGTDHGGVGEQLREIFPAGCVPLRDEAALVSVTRRILADGGAPGTIPHRYTLDAMCAATLEVYAGLLRGE